MKNLFTLLVALVLSQIAFGQIRLDSILVVDPSDQELQQAFRFGYDGDLLTYYSENGIEINISNDSNGNFEKWTILDGYYEQNDLEFRYNSTQQLDSIIFTIEDYGYVLNQYFDFLYENDELVGLELTFEEDGYAYSEETREYFYQGGLLDSIAVSEEYYGLYDTYAYDYDPEGKFIELRRRDEIGLLSQKWVASYENNQLQSLNRFNYSGNQMEILADAYQFEHESSISFSDIQSPQNVFAVIDFIAINEYPEILLPFQNKTQVARIEQQSFGEFSDEYFYYYSSTVGTEDERIVLTPITISPNPTTDLINIMVDQEIASVSLMSLNGQFISQEKTSDRQHNVQDLIAGQYTVIVELVDGSHVFSQFVKH